jgi:hypothetical protein
MLADDARALVITPAAIGGTEKIRRQDPDKR